MHGKRSPKRGQSIIPYPPCWRELARGERPWNIALQASATKRECNLAMSSSDARANRETREQTVRASCWFPQMPQVHTVHAYKNGRTGARELGSNRPPSRVIASSPSSSSSSFPRACTCDESNDEYIHVRQSTRGMRFESNPGNSWRAALLPRVREEVPRNRDVDLASGKDSQSLPHSGMPRVGMICRPSMLSPTSETARFRND